MKYIAYREEKAFYSHPFLSGLKAKSLFCVLNVPALLKLKGIEKFLFHTELKTNIFCILPKMECKDAHSFLRKHRESLLVINPKDISTDPDSQTRSHWYFSLLINATFSRSKRQLSRSKALYVLVIFSVFRVCDGVPKSFWTTAAIFLWQYFFLIPTS